MIADWTRLRVPMVATGSIWIMTGSSQPSQVPWIVE